MSNNIPTSDLMENNSCSMKKITRLAVKCDLSIPYQSCILPPTFFHITSALHFFFFLILLTNKETWVNT